MQTRIFIERQKDYQIECASLMHEMKHVLGIDVPSLRYFVIYDIWGMTPEEFKQTEFTVFAEKNKDFVHHHLDLSKPYVAIEYLPGQYDQRADSALQCVHLLVQNENINIKTGTLMLFDEGIELDQLLKIEDYFINKVEARKKDLSLFDFPEGSQPDKVLVLEGFISFGQQDLIAFHHHMGLAMTMDDLMFVQSYFQKIKRNPTETEIKVLDTYWSDHCRHTTFETILEEIVFEEDEYQTLKQAFLEYQEVRKLLNREEHPMTFMDLATINAKYELKRGNLKDLEISDEHNAASIVIDVDIDGETEPWLLMFKNETHNHPTEIEPFGGASTCIGGAIRDPLSGRSYVYQAMRISGAGDITEPLSKTRKGKLPQRVISKKAAEGYASYGNQIGLATTFVQEIYHEGYKAKRMEVGAVIGCAPQAHVRREKPKPGDLILLIGGRTGRDGIGGATGSSKGHRESSITSSAAEVQKGNAPTERKMQRLFRNQAFSKCVKKANDFGAGGISVAIGELADGISIELDKIPTKYQGLNATELAISESQERMAVVIDPRLELTVKDLCYQENLEVTTVAHVTEEKSLIMTFNGEKVCHIDREFLDASGVRNRQKVIVKSDVWQDVVHQTYEGLDIKEKTFSMLQDLNVTSQQGLVEMFDSTIGTTTVLMPYGGKHQKTKTQVSVQRLPMIHGKTNTVSIMAYGFDPYLSEKNPYLGASYAIIESLAKVVACGGYDQQVRFSFQEYFERLGTSKETWGKPFKSLLGAFKTLKDFGFAAIGGKDSMSGTFEDWHVPPTLISFAVSKGDIRDIISNAFVKKDSYLYLAKHQRDPLGRPHIEQLSRMYHEVHKHIISKTVISAYALTFGGLMEALVKATFGNKIGIEVKTDLHLFDKDYGSILMESSEQLDHPDFIYLGRTTGTEVVTINGISMGIQELLEVNESRFKDIYPITHQEVRLEHCEMISHPHVEDEREIKKKEVHVLLPIFPGTNCEYDSERAFMQAGATVTSFVFNNLTQEDINTSIHLLEHHLDQTDILMLSGGFSSGDEPDGSGKFIANVLRHPLISKAIQRLIHRKGLILGICNGFQALIKSGLLPYGEVMEIDKHDPNLHRNILGRHISKLVHTKAIASKSPWLKGMDHQVYLVPISHGEGRFVVGKNELEMLKENGQIAFQYVNDIGHPSYHPEVNPNGSTFAIEGITSKDGLILGKMGHSERLDRELYKNVPDIKEQSIFTNAVSYIKQRG